MVRHAEDTARSAEQSTSNGVGMCLQWSRERAAIPSLQPDAATAWKHAFNRHPGDKNPPRGAMVYWTGGSKGYGHIAVSLGGGKIRSSDANGNGKPATVSIDWPTQQWGMPYAGWADNVNDQVIPGVTSGSSTEGDDMPQYDHAATGKALKLKEATWTGITWDNVAAGKAMTKGSTVVSLGGRTFSAVVACTLDAPKGATVRVRLVEIENGADAETGPQTETLATDGKSFPTHAAAGKVKAGRTLRVRVFCSQAATLTAADVVFLSW